MGNLIRAEFRKITGSGLWWALMVAAFAVSSLSAHRWGRNVANGFSLALGTYDTDRLARTLGVPADTLPMGMLAISRGVNLGLLLPMIFGICALAGGSASARCGTASPDPS